MSRCSKTIFIKILNYHWNDLPFYQWILSIEVMLSLALWWFWYHILSNIHFGVKLKVTQYVNISILWIFSYIYVLSNFFNNSSSWYNGFFNKLWYIKGFVELVLFSRFIQKNLENNSWPWNVPLDDESPLYSLMINVLSHNIINSLNNWYIIFDL